MMTLDLVSAAAGAAVSVLPALAAGAGVASAKWRRTAATDRLTGISNRAGLPRMAKTMARAARSAPVAVVALDVRHFKTINDTFGHDTGDAVLQVVAQRLAGYPATAGAARLGGDEFAAVITLKRREVIAYSHQLLDLYAHLTRPAATPTGDIHVDVTIGAVLAHRGHTDLTGLLTAADTAMYAARRGGLSLRLAYGPLPTPANRPRLRRRDAHTTTRSEVTV